MQNEKYGLPWYNSNNIEMYCDENYDNVESINETTMVAVYIFSNHAYIISDDLKQKSDNIVYSYDMLNSEKPTISLIGPYKKIKSLLNFLGYKFDSLKSETARICIKDVDIQYLGEYYAEYWMKTKEEY